MHDLLSRIEAVKTRVASACVSCGRAPGSVEILPISKFQPETLIREAGTHGFITFGENYVQEGSAKAMNLPHLGFVLTGPLQRHKAKPAIQYFREIMSVDRVELVLKLGQLAGELDICRGIWVQVDLWNESTKVGGCPKDELPTLLKVIDGFSRLRLKGFMAIPPPNQSESFNEMAELRNKYQVIVGRPLRLSLGMSDDLEDAIAAGSDQVRIGTAIFGSR